MIYEVMELFYSPFHFPAPNNAYDSSQSSTYVKNGNDFTVTYGDGAKEIAFLSVDTLTVAGIRVKSQTFAEITDDSDNWKNSFDGLLGLAYPSNAENKATPPFINMVNKKLLKQPVFAFYYNTYVINTNFHFTSNANFTIFTFIK